MALMVRASDDALRSANVDDDKARRAAGEVADFLQRSGDIELDVAGLKGEIALPKWMPGSVLASKVALLSRPSLSSR